MTDYGSNTTICRILLPTNEELALDARAYLTCLGITFSIDGFQGNRDRIRVGTALWDTEINHLKSMGCEFLSAS